MIYQDLHDNTGILEFEAVAPEPAWWCGYFWIAYLSGFLGILALLCFG